MVVYCTSCWAEKINGQTKCPHCGKLIDNKEADYVTKLIRALNHPEPTTPVRVAWILGEIRAKVAVGPLLDVTRQTKDPYLLSSAVEALGKIGDTRSVTELAELMKKSSIVVRLKAVEALARIGSSESVTAIRDALNDRNISVRQAAKQALYARTNLRIIEP